MKTYFTSFLLMTFLSVNLDAQLPCITEPKFETLHGNDIRASIGNIGNNFYQNGTSNGFEVPYGSGLAISEFDFIQGLWLGGLDLGGNLKVAAAKYGVFSIQNDFWPGPLDETIGVTNFENCGNWNKLWSVRRHEIEAHIKDFEEDGFVSNWQPSIYGWPAKGNVFFQILYGFQLPSTDAGLAPFFDRDNDGIYNPGAGDYPLPENVDVIPEQIIWCSFNDEGAGAIHGESNGLAIRAEIHQTVWVYNCEDNPVLNQTLFKSYKVINRAQEAINDFYLGLFIDLNIRCAFDDGFGANDDLNTVFTYNLNNQDGEGTNCPILNLPEEKPPAFSTTILNRELAHLMPTQVLGNCVGIPSWDIGYYLPLTGYFTPTQPLTFGENGCNPDNPITDLIFPGDPNDLNEWSLLTSGISDLIVDNRYVASVKLNDLGPGEFDVVELAYSYHNTLGNSNLENVTLLYEEVADIHSAYNAHFANVCSQPVCTDDCVWPGDADKDGIANYKDLLSIALSQEKSGDQRPNSLNWAPHNSQPWSGTIPNGPNLKHADCDGSGNIEKEDFETTIANYNNTTPYYINPQDVYQIGPEIYLTRGGSNPLFENIDPGSWFVARVNLLDVPDLYGLAFQMEYDNRYFNGFSSSSGFTIGQDLMKFHEGESVDDDLTTNDYVFVMNELDSILKGGELFSIIVTVHESFDEPLPSDKTEIKFKNIKAIRNDGTEIDIGATTTVVSLNGITTPTIQFENEIDINIFPNPADELVHISSEKEELLEITLLDVVGRSVLNEKINSHEYLLDVGQLKSGLYYVELKYKNGYAIKKLIIQ